VIGLVICWSNLPTWNRPDVVIATKQLQSDFSAPAGSAGQSS
jgi:hypothetical protein